MMPRSSLTEGGRGLENTPQCCTGRKQPSAFRVKTWFLKELTADFGSLTQDNCLKWQKMSPHYTLKSFLMSVFKIFLLNMLHHLYTVFSHSQRLPQFSVSFLLLPFEISLRVISIVAGLFSSYFQSIMKKRERHECENTKFACFTLL